MEGRRDGGMEGGVGGMEDWRDAVVNGRWDGGMEGWIDRLIH